MLVTNFEKHIITECPCCGKLVWAEPAYNLDALDEEYEGHLRAWPKCQEYHDRLPTLEDIRGMLEKNIQK